MELLSSLWSVDETFGGNEENAVAEVDGAWMSTSVQSGITSTGLGGGKGGLGGLLDSGDAWSGMAPAPGGLSSPPPFPLVVDSASTKNPSPGEGGESMPAE